MKRLTAVTVAGLGVVLAGCSPLQREAECMPNEYPVWSTDHSGGSACVKNGEAPPPGYAKYPAGHVPKYADQDYIPTATASPSR